MVAFLSALLGLLSMLSYGWANALSKPLTQKLGPAQFLFLKGVGTSLILAVVAIPSYHYLSHWTVVLEALALGLAGYIPVLAFMHAIRTSPLGMVAPVSGSAPLITVALSVGFLNVTLHKLQWLAIVIIIVANVIVSVDIRNWRQSRLLHKASGIPFALVAAIGWGLFYFFLIPITRVLGPWLASLLVEVGVTVAAGYHIKSTAKKSTFSDAWRPDILFNAVLTCAGTLAFAFGVKHYNVGIVAALSNSTALVTTLLGVLLYQERLHLKERLSALAMIASVAILSLF